MAQAAIERFHERIVRRLARPAEVERDAFLVRPAIERLRDERRAIVHIQESWRPYISLILIDKMAEVPARYH